jgi:hypothetical protein
MIPSKPSRKGRALCSLRRAPEMWALLGAVCTELKQSSVESRHGHRRVDHLQCSLKDDVINRQCVRPCSIPSPLCPGMYGEFQRLLGL